jgi:hypothetical protein
VNDHWHRDLQARAISRQVWERIQEDAFAAHVLAVFDQVCSLVASDGSVISLVLPQIGNGPLNVVVDGVPGDFAFIAAGTPCFVVGNRLQVGGMAVSLKGVDVWESRPNWERLRVSRIAIAKRLFLVQTTAQHHAPEDSLLALLSKPAPSKPGGQLPSKSSWRGTNHCYDPSRSPRLGPISAIQASARRGAVAIQNGWMGEKAWLQSGAAQLAGLGGGLTPAGDDFLMGVMMWAWLAHPTPHHLCDNLLEAAVPRTTTLSAAFLLAAAQGECNAPWHCLFTSLEHGTGGQLAAATRTVLAYGHTSGADALAGFLWVGRQPETG